MRQAMLLLSIIVGRVFSATAQIQLDFTVAPAPAPHAFALASEEQPDRPEVAAPIKPVSTPILTALEPIAGDAMADAKTVAQDVRSGVDGVKSAVPDIVDSFHSRKLLAINAEAVRSKRLRTIEGTPSLKRLQLQADAQKGRAQAAATNAQMQSIDAPDGSQVKSEDDDARIERELAKMKEDRLKAIQALPRSVWS